METVDTSALERRAAEFPARLRKASIEWAREIADEIGASMRAQMDPNRVPAGVRSSSSRIGSKPGAGGVRDATYRGARGNISTTNLAGEKVDIVHGISAQVYPYVTIHDEGGEVRPKRAKALAVPITEEAREAIRAADGDLRSLDLFVVKGKSGKAFLARRDGEDIERMFMLLGKVTITARPIRKPALRHLESTMLPEMLERLRSDAATEWEMMG